MATGDGESRRLQAVIVRHIDSSEAFFSLATSFNLLYRVRSLMGSESLELAIFVGALIPATDILFVIIFLDVVSNALCFYVGRDGSTGGRDT